jgi:hypothetical protein
VALVAFVCVLAGILYLLLPSARQLEELNTNGPPTELSLNHLRALVAAKLPDDPQGQALVLGLEAEQVELELQADELRESQRHASELVVHYRQLFAESPLAMVLLSPTRHVRELNHRALTTLGLASTPSPPRRLSSARTSRRERIARRVGESRRLRAARVAPGGESAARADDHAARRRAAARWTTSPSCVAPRAPPRGDARLPVLRGSHDGKTSPTVDGSSR